MFEKPPTRDASSTDHDADLSAGDRATAAGKRRARTDGAPASPEIQDAPGPRISSGDPGQRMGDWQASAISDAMGLGAGPLTGNPAERRDKQGADLTAHRAPTLADTTGAPKQSGPPGMDPRLRNVKVLASRAQPLTFDGPRAISDGDLYEEGPDSSPPPDGYLRIHGTLGSASAPLTELATGPELFIKGTPTADDVDQGGIGDCYLMAALAGIAARDPGFLKSMMKPDGNGGAVVTLWRREDTRVTLMDHIQRTPPHRYIPVQIAVSDELAFKTSDKDLLGAALRCAPSPERVDYWAEPTGPMLSINRKETYQLARWVPLLEKAYARFAQEHGQYGGAAQSGKPAGTGGYDAIEGGSPVQTMRVLYGARADAPGALQYEAITSFPDAGNNILAANPRAVDQLLLLAGRGETARAYDVTAPILVALTTPDDQVRNLGTAITRVIADADFSASLSPEVQGKLTALLGLATADAATPPDPPNTEGPKAAARKQIAALCAELTNPSAELMSEARSPAVRAFTELALNVRTLGTDDSSGQRNLYTNHGYTVVSINFVDALGHRVALEDAAPEGRAMLFPLVDCEASKIRVRNPHHQNEPDRAGVNKPNRAGDGAPDGGKSDGVFTLSVNEFFRNFNGLDSGHFVATKGP